MKKDKTKQRYARFISDSVASVKHKILSTDNIQWEFTILLKNNSYEKIFINDIVLECNCIKYKLEKKPFTFNETKKLIFLYLQNKNNYYFNKNIVIIMNNGKYFYNINLKQSELDK
ncbi:MAG: DUF1573 domain-containing protein [Prevotella sp.]|nr:DUF1573 domain-containing protein [Prevotella sp.]MDY4218648.1 DUF1573 domain-containing protein [Prevotella sp.]